METLTRIFVTVAGVVGSLLFNPEQVAGQGASSLRRLGVGRLCIAIGASALIVGATISIWRSLRGSPGTLDSRPYQYMGVVAAQETARLLGNQGQVVVWRLRINNKFNRPLDAAVQGFEHELHRSGKFDIAATEEKSIQATGDLPLILNAPAPAEFVELVRRYDRADALVLFGSVPALSEADIARLPTRRPRIVMASIFQMPQRNLLERDVAQVVIAPRDHPHGDGQTQAAAEWFDCMYVVLTSANAATLRK